MPKSLRQTIRAWFDDPSHPRRWGNVSLLCGFLAWMCPAAILGMFGHLSASALPVLVLVLLAPILALAAIISGHGAGARSDNEENAPRERGPAGTGLFLGYALLVILGVPVISFSVGSIFINTPNSVGAMITPQERCRSYLGVLGTAMEQYASVNGPHYYPELSPKPGQLIFRQFDAFGANLPGQKYFFQEMLICPSVDRGAELPIEGEQPSIDAYFEQSSYIYPGYALHDDAGVEAFAAAYRKRLADGLPFDGILTVPDGTGGMTRVIRRLRGKDVVPSEGEGEGKHSPKSPYDGGPKSPEDEVRSRVPVLIERLGHHQPEGGYVLFLDGRVEYLNYPGPWPMTEKTMGMLRALEEGQPK